MPRATGGWSDFTPVEAGFSADFDCDNVFDTALVTVDLNRRGGLQVLPGHDDWDNLDFHFHCEPGYGDGAHLPGDSSDTGWEPELDLETAAREKILHPSILIELRPPAPCPFLLYPTDTPAHIELALLGTAQLDAAGIDPATAA